MSSSTAYATQLLDLLFNNTADAVGIAAVGSATTWYIALHTASPGVGGSQNTSEAAYTSYARVAVTRSSGGWTISGANYQNDAAITFPTATGGSETESYFSIGTAATGAGQILLFGTVTTPLAVTTGVQPVFSAGALTGTVS